jgi:protein-S-isoprenylcysteine O-methyltransferase Ste14
MAAVTPPREVAAEASAQSGVAPLTATRKTRWQKIARRIRVPLGFVVAAVFLVAARPTAATLAWGLLLILPGLWLRGYAAGYVKKNAELTRTGPYAYTRNPLYLGSMGIAAGFAVAAGRWWLGALLVLLFLAIYLPTILSEEAYLRSVFTGFEAYAQRVPRLLPRLTPARFADLGEAGGRFAPERYRHHREYNALMGAAALYLALWLRMAVPWSRLGAALTSLLRH